MQERIKNLVHRALDSFGVPKDMIEVKLDHPSDFKHGDYSTNVAMVLIKSLGATMKSPMDLALKIVEKINEELNLTKNTSIEKVEAILPGFINFHLSAAAFTEIVSEINDKKVWYGKNTKLWNRRLMFEYTDPNPFKQFHIGHLMANAIGESLSRLYEFHDAKVTRATYGGDVGLHVAKSMWGVFQLKNEFPKNAGEQEQIAYLGKAYVLGAAAYEKDEQAQKEIKILNEKIFKRTDDEVNEIYDWGKALSIKHFKEIYIKLGSRFDYEFYESEVAEEGMNIVAAYLAQGVFEKSEGAVIFPGEKYGLHNRVFVTSQGLPTYETKELGLTKRKFELHDFNQSIVVTANEQDDYFAVLTKVLELIYPEIGTRTKHISHGMMRFDSGKMSSRLGNVVTGESLLHDIEEMILEKMEDRDMSAIEKQEIAEKVAVGAIKYTILRQSIGKDIIFDPEKSLSFEGDSGPYLQYTYVRARSILAKAEAEKIKPHSYARQSSSEISNVERFLGKFPEIVERAAADYSPTYIATYLISLASEFNSYYGQHQIVNPKEKESAYRVALTEAVSWTLKNGLYLLGIPTPEKM